MHLIQKEFKSPVYKMNIEEQKKLLTMQRTTRSQLREGDRAWEPERSGDSQQAKQCWQRRLWENHQAMNKKSIRGRRGGMSWHNIAKFRHLAPQVNGTLGWWWIKCLPGEISQACVPCKRRASAVATRWMTREKSAEAIVAGIKQTGGRNARLNRDTHGTNHPVKG